MVPPELDGHRADKVVAALAGVSRALARRLVQQGAVRVAGKSVTASDRLIAGSNVEVEIPAAAPVPSPEPVPFQVMREDPAFLVIDKPAGVVVHPGAGRSSGTLAEALLQRYPDLEGVGEAGRRGIVHRLDKDTSGLLVVARTAPAHRALTNAMANRRIHRRYLALVHGQVQPPRGTIDAPLGRDSRRPTRRAVDVVGRPARTHYRRLDTFKDAGLSLLEVELETGRTHQIRVHLAAIGHPVVGDRVYGGRPDPSSAGRLWLHASSLSFPHPETGEPVEVSSELPSELAQSLRRLGAKR